ncbi:hypothetical protein FS837_011531 [Tulasnella sp. UAMH 9824]|nr:hypothetical protein FS837_011531 [Tulasnella sp. UAMH 9824]
MDTPPRPDIYKTPSQAAAPNGSGPRSAAGVTYPGGPNGFTTPAAASSIMPSMPSNMADPRAGSNMAARNGSFSPVVPFGLSSTTPHGLPQRPVAPSATFSTADGFYSSTLPQRPPCLSGAGPSLPLPPGPRRGTSSLPGLTPSGERTVAVSSGPQPPGLGQEFGSGAGPSMEGRALWTAPPVDNKEVQEALKPVFERLKRMYWDLAEARRSKRSGPPC